MAVPVLLTAFKTVALLATSVVTAPSAGSVMRAKVDLVELNHFLDDQGREVFRLVIFFDWSRKNRQFEVRAWRLIKQPSQLPRTDHRGSGYTVTWQDNSITRQVIASAKRETWSQQDPERVNRSRLPENERRPLWEPK